MFIFTWLEDLPWAYGSLIMIAIFIAFTIGGIFVIRKYIHFKKLQAHHDVAGFVFTNLGVLYAVLLGFTVVNVQQRFDKLKEISEVEAGYVALLYQDAEVFPEKNRIEIRDSIKKYALDVSTEEWNLMKQGEASLKAETALKNIWNSYYKINPSTNKEIAWYSESISKLNLLMNARLKRLLGSNESLGSEMWTFLILGGLAMVTFTWFFGVENLTSHILMASILAASTAFLLYLIYSLDTAFSGNISIPSFAIENVLKSFQ